jgi:tetratricopeptide (TPR) repeat protein
MFPFVLIISLFGVYLSTICPTVYLGDSGELTAAAFCLGIPHGSGYPLYTLIGKFFCLIPIGHVGFRMNLMSMFFAVMTVWLVYSLIHRMTSSKVGAFVGGLALAFTPVLWLQTVPAEVYTLHTFFVALLIRLLWWWDEKREFFSLMLLTFLAGLSFGNHMQTVMLAPAILYIILSADRKVLFNVKHFLLLSVFFVLALSIYLYLPIRTWAGAAIHWGDPDSLDRFLAHVTGRSHRGGYVFNMGVWEYLVRTKASLWFVGSQFGVMLLLALWGWVKLSFLRWRLFFVLLIVFDFIYTIFLNTISLEITPFNLPTCIVLAILIGVGVAEVLKASEGFERIGLGTRRAIKAGCCLVPFIPLLLNFTLCDQRRNYTAYEHAVNIFRTVDHGDILFMNGDNYVFPVTYGRLVERMREDVSLYDRLNILFRMPDVDFRKGRPTLAWEAQRNQVENMIIEGKGVRGVYYAVFGPYAIAISDEYALIPYGILHRVVEKEVLARPYRLDNVWRYYSTESLYDDFQRDFMNREMSAYFHFGRGKDLILSGQPSLGLKNLELAAQTGYNDNLIYSDMAVFLTDHGYFEQARRALEKALIYHEDLSGVYNNWGYFYHRIREYEKAVASFRRAIELRPDRFGFHNNLGFALYEAGDKKESLSAFQKSLDINENQPEIRKFIRENIPNREVTE